MLRREELIQKRRTRTGKILVLCALLLPVMLGMVGLVVDTGLVMAGHLQALNAADAGALAATRDKLGGKSDATATATATKFIQQYNGLANATVSVNMPPSQGQYAGNSRYVETIVSLPVNTTFIQLLGITSPQTVMARSVAGYEAVSSGEGVAVLDPTAIPGLSVQGGGTLNVKGRVVVNSIGRGVDENGDPVDLGANAYAATTGNGSVVKAKQMYVVGGVDVPDNYQPYTAGDPNPLHARALPEPDPLTSLPVPTAGMSSVNTTYRGGVQVTGGTTTLDPGIYDYIKITNNANAVFNPGVYIVASTSQNAISFTGSGSITGDGVLFYNTASDYNPTNPPDANDGETPPPKSIPGNPTMGDVTINAANVALTGLNDPSSPFNGMLFYQRRWNTQDINIQGTGTTNMLTGSLYAKWARFKLAGEGTYGAQFIAGSLSISGQANVTLNYAGKSLGKANQIYLVE